MQRRSSRETARSRGHKGEPNPAPRVTWSGCSRPVGSMRVRPSSPFETLPFLLNSHLLSVLLSSLAPLTQLFKILCDRDRFSIALDDTLDVWQIQPRKDGSHGSYRAKEQENETLSRFALISRIDSVNNCDCNYAAELTCRGRDAVAGASIAGRENLGRDDKSKGIRTCGNTVSKGGSFWVDGSVKSYQS